MATQPKPNSAQDHSDPEQAGRVARLRAALKARLPQWSRRTKITVLIAVLLIVAHGAAIVIWLPRYLAPAPKNRWNIAMALAALDRHALPEARHIATLIEEENLLTSSDRGGPMFVLGAVAAEEAELLPASERSAAYRSAAKMLEEARQRGFPASRQAQGLFWLGKCRSLSGDFVGCRIPLEEAAHADGNLAAQTNELLASAYSQGTDPDFAKARQFSERCLTDPSLSTEDRQRAQLLNAQILEKLNDLSGCKAALAQIPPQSGFYPAALALEAKTLMREAGAMLEHSPSNREALDSANAKYLQAIEKLKLVQSSGKSNPALDRRAEYLTGLCWLESNNLPAAVEQFERVLVRSGGSDEAVAAAFQSANLLCRQGRYDEAVAKYQRVVKAIGDPAAYHSELLSIAEVRKQMLAAYEQLLNQSQIDNAIQLSRLMQSLFPPERELELNGELFRSAANSYLSKAGAAEAAQHNVLAAKARLNYRLAGLSFFKLAELHTTARTYTDDLWNAAECFEQGHDFQHVEKTLQVYLKNELRRRRAAALRMLGEAQLTLGQTDQALTSLHECTDGYPTDPASSTARLLLAKALEEKGDSAEAERLLRANLEGGVLTPRSTEWRDSLFTLAKLLAGQARYQDAILRLEEAVARYPQAAQAVEAKYLAAECYRRLGLEERQKMTDDAIDASRKLHQKQMQENLTAAIVRFQQLVTSLAGERTSDERPLEKSILRNSYFALGLSLVDMNRLDDAIGVYSAIANLYRNEPEVLEALVQMSNCYRRLDRFPEARGSIAQAKTALDCLSKDTDFRSTTNYTRDQWRQILDRQAAL